MQKYYKSLMIFSLFFNLLYCQAQTAYFADGFHGGIYGHYPMWQTKFMVNKLRENPRWKINLEIEPETWDSVKIKDRANYTLFREYYSKTGRHGKVEFVNPAYAQPYCYNISGESIIRQFSYGMKKIQEHFPEATFLTYSSEEPCFTSCLPQILTSFGFRYAVLKNPDTCWGGYTSAFGKDLVNWKSSDGSAILTVPRYACEKLVKGSTWQTDSWNNSVDFINGCFNNEIKYPVGMCFQDAGWKGGPWLENVIQSFYQPSEYILWTDYIESISSEVNPVDWEFSQEDVKPGLVWGAQVLQKLAQEVRYSENRLIAAEKMASLSKVFFSEQWPEKQIDEAWRTLMLSQHHDCWIVPYNGEPGNTWADKARQWTSSTNQIADSIIDRVFDHMQRKLESDDRYIIVFNTLAISRTGLAAILLPKDFNYPGAQVFDLDGHEVKSQIIIENNSPKMLVFKASIPAMGYSAFRLVKKDVRSKKMDVNRLNDGTLKVETNYYTAIIDPKKGGTITSLLAKKMGNIQLVEKGKELNNLKGYFYEEGKFYYGSNLNAKVTVIENGELLLQIKIENQLVGNPYYQVITFVNDQPRIDFELTIDWENQHGIGAYSQKNTYRNEDLRKAFYNDKYKLQVQFPLKGVGKRLFKNAPFDVCESKLKNTYYSRWDSIKNNVILNWVDVSDASNKLGVALFSDHTTSYIHDEDMPLALTIQYVGKGLWGRDYTLDGSTHVKYALLPHPQSWDKYGVSAECSAWNEPLLAGVSNTLPVNVEESFVNVDDDGLEISSMTVSGDDLYIRFYNAEANQEDKEITLNCIAQKIELVNLKGDVIRQIVPELTDSNGLRIKLSILRFEFQTIKLTKVKAK